MKFFCVKNFTSNCFELTRSRTTTAIISGIFHPNGLISFLPPEKNGINIQLKKLPSSYDVASDGRVQVSFGLGPGQRD